MLTLKLGLGDARPQHSRLSILFLTIPVTTPPFHISAATQRSPFVQSDMYTPTLWVYLDAITTLPDNGRNLACPMYALWTLQRDKPLIDMQGIKDNLRMATNGLETLKCAKCAKLA